MTDPFPSNNNEGVILNDATQSHSSHGNGQQYQLGQQLPLLQQQSSSSGHQVANRYNSNKTESTTTITTNIATTPASTTASLHGDNKSDVDDDDDDDDEEDEHGVESEPNCGGDVSGGECDPHRNYDTISLTPSVGSRRRHYGHGHGHSHGHGHGHSHYFHHHNNNRHRRTPSSSSLASNTLRRGTHSSSGGSGNCCDYLKVTVSDHQSPKIYVEKCCAGGSSSDHHLDDEVEKYFYVHQGSSRKSSLAHGANGGGTGSQFGSHCSLNRSRCGSIRRRRSDHSITTTTADVIASGGGHHTGTGSRTTTPLIHRNSNERLRQMAAAGRTISPMMLEFHNSYQGGGGVSGGRGRASSSGSAGSCPARDDGDPGDYAEVQRAGVRIKCKHHSLEVSEDDIVLSLNEPGGGVEPSSGAAAMASGETSGRGSSTSLKHLLERDNSGEIVILTPSKITIENYPMMVRVPRTAPTTPEAGRRREAVIVSPLPDYACAPSPIHWHFPCSDSDGTGNSGTNGTSDDMTTSPSTEESQTVIQNYQQKSGECSFRRPPATKTVSIWRTSENSDEETSAVIFHHESGTVENYSSNSSRTFIRLQDPSDNQNNVKSKCPEESLKGPHAPVVRTTSSSGPMLNNAIVTPRKGESNLKMSHNNAFPTLSSVHDLSNEIRRFQKTSNFEPLTSNNLLSTVERNQSRRHQSDAISCIETATDGVATASALNNRRRSSVPAMADTRHITELPAYFSGMQTNRDEDRFDLTSRIESFVRRFNKPTSIALTTLNRLSPTGHGHLGISGTGGRIRNRFGGIERRRRRRKHQRSQIQTIRRLLGGSSGPDEEHPHLLQTELDWINEDLMRTQAERGHEDPEEELIVRRGLMTNIRRRVRKTFNIFKKS